MLDPNAQVNIDRQKIEETKPSPISMMPEGLLSTLNEDEIADLVAYLLSRGDRNPKCSTDDLVEVVVTQFPNFPDSEDLGGRGYGSP